MQFSILTIIFADRGSFLEENHEYKIESQARQSQQAPQPGRPSQDLMSFWGQWPNSLKCGH
jgi:hypothetical protein